MTGSLWHLVLAAALFLAAHMVPSSTTLRPRLVAVLGDWVYLVLYSALSLLLLSWTVDAYQDAPVHVLWIAPAGVRLISTALMLVACILLVGAVTAPNPTRLGADSAKIVEQGPRGMFKITRHPGMWSFGLWGIAHMLANGEAAQLILFGTFAVLAIAGSMHLDRRKRATVGGQWVDFESRTSNLPFVALIKGKCRLSLAEIRSEIGYGRLVAGLVLFAVLMMAHESMSGVSLVPN